MESVDIRNIETISPIARALKIVRNTTAVSAGVILMLAGSLFISACGSGDKWNVKYEDLQVDARKNAHGAVSGRYIYLVPLGKFSYPSLDQLSKHLERKLDLKIKVLEPVSSVDKAWDNDRKQLVAEDLATLMTDDLRHEAKNLGTILIGVTNIDMYIRRMKNWRYGFSNRSLNRFAVVSSARMDDTFWGGEPNKERTNERLRKIVLKQIGVLYYELDQVDDSKSVLYNNILSPEDLDEIDERF